MRDTLVVSGSFTYLDTVKANYIGKIWGDFENLSTCLNIGVNEFKSINEVSIYPNASSTYIKVSSINRFQNGSLVEIIDCLGQLVKSDKLTSDTIDISGLKIGCYFLIIKNSTYTFRFKFVKIE